MTRLVCFLLRRMQLYDEATFSLKNWRLNVNICTVRFHANGIEIKVFDFKVIDPAVIKYFSCIYNYQIYNEAEIKLNKIFGRVDKILKPSAYGTIQSKSHKWHGMHPIVYNCCLRSLVFLPHKVQTREKPFKVMVFNKQLNDQEDKFQSITEYIYPNLLTELRT